MILAGLAHMTWDQWSVGWSRLPSDSVLPSLIFLLASPILLSQGRWRHKNTNGNHTMLLEAWAWNWHTIIFASITYLRQTERASPTQALGIKKIYLIVRNYDTTWQRAGKGEDKEMRSSHSTTNIQLTSTVAPWSPYHNLILFPCNLYMILVI